MSAPRRAPVRGAASANCSAGGSSGAGGAAAAGSLAPQALQKCAGSSTAVPHSAQTSLGGPVCSGSRAPQPRQNMSPLRYCASHARTGETGRARVLHHLARDVQLDLLAEEEPRAADGHDVAVAQALLAHPVAVDHRAVRGVAVAEVVLAAPELDDRVPARDHGVGQNEVVGRVAADGQERPTERDLPPVGGRRVHEQLGQGHLANPRGTSASG